MSDNCVTLAWKYNVLRICNWSILLISLWYWIQIVILDSIWLVQKKGYVFHRQNGPIVILRVKVSVKRNYIYVLKVCNFLWDFDFVKDQNRIFLREFNFWNWKEDQDFCRNLIISFSCFYQNLEIFFDVKIRFFWIHSSN